MEIPENPRIAIVGGGSWATAIAKILLETNEHINWFMRNIETINAFKELNHNPRYLCSVDFDLSRISFTDNLDKLIARSDIIIFAIPSAFLKNVVAKATRPLKDKIVVSAIKGMIPDDNLADRLLDSGVEIDREENTGSSILSFIVGWVLPSALMIGLLYFIGIVSGKLVPFNQ